MPQRGAPYYTSTGFRVVEGQREDIMAVYIWNDATQDYTAVATGLNYTQAKKRFYEELEQEVGRELSLAQKGRA
jgi:hypothetical protein